MSPPAPAPKVTPPSKLAHVVLRTTQANYGTMVTYYQNFLGARVVQANDIVTFMTYDDEHHRIAIGALPGVVSKPVGSGLLPGLEHVAFTFDSLRDLCTAYRERKELGMVPVWCVNHGPTTSMYYADPDGNKIETQAENFDTMEEANAYMQSDDFRNNSMGADFDPEELCRRVDAGEDEHLLKKIDITDVGHRMLPPAAFMNVGVA